MSNTSTFKVGEWTVAPSLCRLERPERSVKLKPRVMQLLCCLAARPGEVISPDELIASVWRGRAVGDGSIYHAVNQLRNALGENGGNAKYIETVPKRGYRLIAAVTAVESRDDEHDSPGTSRKRAARPVGAYAGTGVALVILVVVATLARFPANRAISPSEQELFEAPPTASTEAYLFYLDALGVGNGPRAWAIENLDRAIDADPDFALAYAEKARLLANQGRRGPPNLTEAERIHQARVAAEKALELDPNLAAAHEALAALLVSEGRWAEAEQAYEQISESFPRNASILEAYGTLKRDLGKYGEAVTLHERAAELDPNAPRYQLGISYRYAKDYDAAATAFRQAIDLEPTIIMNHMHLGITEAARGNHDEALRELVAAERGWGENLRPVRLVQLAYAYANAGRADDARRLVANLTERASQDERSDRDEIWVVAHLAEGEHERAYERLEALLSANPQGYVQLGQVKANDFNDPVLDEPRWRAARDRLGAPFTIQ